jgi:fructokinase
MRIISFGELLWDVFPTGEVLGGAPANFAYRMNSLGHEGLLVTRLGNDDLGRRAADLVGAQGMSTEFVQWDDAHPTGTVPITLEADGSPIFTILPNVAFDCIEATDSLLGLAARADWICFGTLIQRNETSRDTLHAVLERSPKSKKLLDLNLRKDCFTLETIVDSLERANVLKLNENEAKFLAEKFDLPSDVEKFAAAIVARWNLNYCVITLGPDGVAAANGSGEVIRRAGHRIKVVDTCGAGDAFTAGFLHSVSSGKSLAAACDFANALGALVAQSRGGTAPVSLDEIESLLKKAA